MQNQMCRVCEEPAAGFHFGAFTCEGCKSFFGRTCNNQSVIQECKNNYRCVINKKNRTACKACRLRKCLMVGMSKSGSRYGRRSNWFKIHCLMQQASGGSGGGSNNKISTPSTTSTSSLTSIESVSVPPRNGTNSTLSSPPLWRPLDSPSPKSSLPSQRSSSPPPSPSPAAMLPKGAFNFLGLQNGISNSIIHGGPPVKSKHQEPEVLRSPPPPIIPSTPPTSTPTFPFAAAHSLYSPFSSALPFLPPTFNIPGLSALPLHKQALLSPLLASSHFLAAARKAYPFLPTSSSPPTTPVQEVTSDVLAEHKALLERFRASAAAMAAAAALNNNTENSNDKQPSGPTTDVTTGTIDDIADQGSNTPPPSSNSSLVQVVGNRKDGTHPMDLSKRSSSEDSVSSVGSEIIPHLSDTDEEVEDTLDQEKDAEQHGTTTDDSNTNAAVVGATTDAASNKRKTETEMPLDLTCV